MEFSGSNYFRFRLALSLISGKSITIKNIRKNKNGIKNNKELDKISKEPEIEGLHEYEAKILKLIDKLCDNTIIKINENGDELYFKPGFLVGNVNDEVKINDLNIIFHCGKERSITYFLEFLLMIIPFFKNPVKLLLKGITDDSIDSTVYTLKIVSEHFFKTFLKVDENFLNITILKRGIKSDCSGEVLFFMNNFKSIDSFDINDPGLVKKISGSIFCNNVSLIFRNKFMNCAKKNLCKFTPYVSIEAENAKLKKNNEENHFISLSLFAHTQNKCIYATDLCIDEFLLKHVKDSLNINNKNNETDSTSQGTSNGNNIQNVENKLEKSKKNEENFLINNSSNSFSKEEKNCIDYNSFLNNMSSNLHQVDIYERLGFFVSLKIANEIKGLSSVDTNYQWLPLLYMALANDTSVSKITLNILKPYSIALIRLLNDFFSVVFDIKKVEKSQIDYSYIIKCVGVGYRNFSKKTF
ncbi:RNA 3'-terminal phosphate cyclase-like protein, putative [Plasmodium relictum]|uniref:RNA 3'-terminal phosphate cyclase-like protein, putative n=1 Tax=Plasmodium relictum TaxID=85471 RepID=A0A1J1H9A1_PLARL|nr:RNA 3'-terminal phosphate cyclase-like protein, putative [Plasmodium relictum]CRH01213.1 RNA 3'-terminal phosphate cyclase-like protein, putative [Plasmodium relictum]